MHITAELLVSLITVFFGAGWFGQFLLARYSKTKKQRDIDISKDYLSLVNMTADELEKRINLIGKLSDDVHTLSNENYLLKVKQNQRDEQLKEMEAKQTALQVQIDADTRDRADLRNKLAEFDVRYRVLFRYLLANLEHMNKHGVDPVTPPDELKGDPDIVKLTTKKVK